MSLFGALFSGVSGLNAQGTAMSVIADNITNVNTIGYKKTKTNFETLVNGAETSTRYAPGGVKAAPQALLDVQGQLQASVSATDLAINGNGFFVVTDVAIPTTVSGSYLYTRAGSFTQDLDGNLKNSAGFFLQGWPVDQTTGLIPTNRSDLTVLQPVNVDGLAGTASATTTVSLQANLDASQAVTASLPSDTTTVAGIKSTTDLGNTPPALADGDQFTISSNIGNISQVFEYDPTPTSSNFEFSTLQELADLINSVDGLKASIGGTSSAATLTLSGPPNGTLTTADTTNTPATSLFGAVGAVGSPTYAANTTTTNMASTNVTPDFERSVAIYDSQGGSHTLTFGFLKSTLANTWLVEAYIEPSTEIDPADANQGPDGIIAAGTLTFNSDGSINTTNFSTSLPSDATATTGITAAVEIPWASSLGLAAQNITIDWGTDDTTDGLTQFDSSSNLISTSVDGAIFGELANVTVTDLGVVTAVFTNGITQPIYQLPVAIFSNEGGLEALSGNAYQETDLSGTFSLQEANVGGAGLVAPSFLEASTVDLAEEFANMIVSQRSFSASSRVITTSDDMLDELIRIKR